ncbi:hypothetical protein QN277_013178 [Acacia crassicarpa]|uniref:Uncharacterized protein n=1 Tax=Acacia crassicarpa TaxID=499986 RepID=A0AAE1TDT3_9FABA|nr:hypothetical protein QN277_013178 [Acacia crassicarpa]
MGSLLHLLKPPLDSSCSLLRMLVTVDVKPTMLSEKSIDTLGGYFSEYLMDVVQVSNLSVFLPYFPRMVGLLMSFMIGLTRREYWMTTVKRGKPNVFILSFVS